MEKELMQLGLDYYESKALSLLFNSKLNLRQISDKAKIPFGKVYSVVKNLKEKGLVKETNSRPKLIYVDNASEIISNLIELKKKNDLEIESKLKETASQFDRNKGKETKFFQIGTTTEDNRNIQLRTFKEAKNEVLQILNIYHKPHSNRQSKNLWEKSIVKAVERGIIFKSIYPIKSKIPILLEKLNERSPEKFQIKRIGTDFTRCDIIDEDKVLIKLVHEDPLQFGGVLFIEDEKLNENLRKIFYELWEKSEEE